MSGTMRGEISEDGKTWVPLYATKSTKVQDSEKSAVEATVRGLEQGVQEFNRDKVSSLLTPDARWIEHSLPVKFDDEWQLVDKLKVAGIRIAYQLHDLETHVEGDVAWVTLTIDGTFSADSAEGQKLLPHKAESGCVAGNPCESRMTYVESEVLVKTSSGWKIALGHTTALPKAPK